MDTFGSKFRVCIFGESHGSVVGALLDGVPAGLPLSVEDFAGDLFRRSPEGEYTTVRHESDEPIFLSGVFKGRTTGAPLCIVFKNSDVQSSDYSFLPSIPRPGHADYPAFFKFGGNADYRGGGQFSGRLTLPIVAAGVVARNILSDGVDINAKVVRLGGSDCKDDWPKLLQSAKNDGDSLGAVVECQVEGLRIGVGEPFWDSLESLISHAIFSIPGVRGIEFGDGFRASDMRGSQHNDPIGLHGPLTNHAGGVNGGMSNGAPLLFRVAFKPTSSISRLQHTYNFAAEGDVEFRVPGRHDVCFALRTPVIVEAMTAIVLCNLL